MFRLEGFVDDKQLSKVLHALDGLVMDLRTLPVRNAVKKNGKLKSTAANSTIEAIATYLSAYEPETITTGQIKDVLATAGFAATGVQHALQQAIKTKLLKKGKVRGQYVVVVNKKAR